MRGLLADQNVEGHQARIEKLLEPRGLRKALAELGLEFATFVEAGFERDIDDRSLWQRCQEDGWVLFTDNRNDDGETSLQATLSSLWSPGKLPVLTLASKTRFEHDANYRKLVADEIAELLFSILAGDSRDCDRVFVPR